MTILGLDLFMSSKNLERRIVPFFLCLLIGVSVSAAEVTWKSANEISQKALERADLKGPGPRDATGYLPEKKYPFTSPLNAEEIGYRLMNFNHVASWAHMLADCYGSVTKEGYLTEGITLGMIDNVGSEGGPEARIYGSPGDVFQRWNYYYTYPPKSEGEQQVWHLRRTGRDEPTKLDFFVYSPSLRRVRRQPPPRRDAQFPNSVQTFDDIVGLEAWEFEWTLIGSDILYSTVRFPSNRPTLTLARAGGRFYEQEASKIRMMGDDYPHYRKDNGIDTFVVTAVPRGDWLPKYRIGRVVYWVDQHYFFPLRIETYDREGELLAIQVRMGERQNPNLPDGHGYTNPHSAYWDVRLDLVTYSAHDSMALAEWTKEEKETLFNPDFMRRRWNRNNAKSQVLIRDPKRFHLRPEILEGRFPTYRSINLSPEVLARVKAQNAAGRLVFEGETLE